MNYIKQNDNRNKILSLEKMRTDNPTEFWHELKRTGPKKKINIPMEIKNSAGEIVTDKDV